MRIVAGTYGGRRITAPAGRSTRPTSDRVREALFSILGSVEGLRVLDLFAGSGALGIEALSRGAVEAVFVDSDPRAVQAIEQNVANLGAAGRVTRRDALAWLKAGDGTFDLVFVDPPYSSARQMGARLDELLPPLLTETSLTVTESDKRDPLMLAMPLIDERTYGDTRIAIHRGR
jgi:16S rRNA (guanine966-N2)-methyltransferase